MGCVKKALLIGMMLVVSAGGTFSQYLFAQSKKKTIRIATVEYPPAFLADGTGVASSMLSELLGKMGYDVEIGLYPLGRAIKMVNKGRVECAFLYPQTDPDETVAILIYYTSPVFVYKKSKFPNGVRFKTLSELKDYKIGALTNSKWFIKLLQKDAGLNLDFAPDNEMNMKKLHAERIDLLPLSHIAALPLIKSVFPNRTKEFGMTKAFGITPVCLIFSRKFPNNQKIIDDVKKKLLKTDVRTLMQKYFGKCFQEGVIPAYMLTGKEK